MSLACPTISNPLLSNFFKYQTSTDNICMNWRIIANKREHFESSWQNFTFEEHRVVYNKIVGIGTFHSRCNLHSIIDVRLLYCNQLGSKHVLISINCFFHRNSLLILRLFHFESPSIII